jgi:hypothetical protein
LSNLRNAFLRGYVSVNQYKQFYDLTANAGANRNSKLALFSYRPRLTTLN